MLQFYEKTVTLRTVPAVNTDFGTRYDIEKPQIRRYIRRKLGIINSQKQMITDLRLQIDSKNELLKRLAAEYTIFGP